MITISQAVRESIERSPFLTEVLSEGLANTTEVARKLRPDIEKRLYQKVTDASIAMALHRLSKELKRPQFGTKFLKQLSDITVRSKVIEFVFPNTPNLPRILEVLLKSIKGRKDIFLNFSQGLHESVVVVNKEFETEFLKLFKKEKPKRMDTLSVITLRLPEASLAVPGVYYPILKTLAAEGISFIEIMSVNTELSIVFNDKDVDRAFAALKRVTS
jgi:hypothetical protein